MSHHDYSSALHRDCNGSLRELRHVALDYATYGDHQDDVCDFIASEHGLSWLGRRRRQHTRPPRRLGSRSFYEGRGGNL